MRGIIKKIDKIQFGLMSPEQIREMSVIKVERPDTYDEDGYPIEGGLMDARMGVIDPSLRCPICGENGGKCQGHFGMIELGRPVIHAGFGDDIYKILRSTCCECGRVLLDDDEIEYYKERMDNLLQAGKSVDELVKEVYKICKDKKAKEVCPHCGAEQTDFKIVKPIDIIEVRKQYDEEGNIITYDDGTPITEDYDLTASEVREKLQRIPDRDAYVLGVNPKVTRPEWMVLTVLPVPPVPIRPTISLDTGEQSEDDLTHKLVEVIRINQRLIENMEAGAPQLIVEDLWKLLQYHVTTYFDNEASGVPPARHRSGRPYKTLAQRLKGKEGRFRSNLSGKRVNFSARTVISPDPNISINEVGVPEIIAKEVTVPTYVTKWNVKELKEAILNGPYVHPGANYVKKIINGKEMKLRVLEDNREIVVENLEYGDIVMRHLRDGDIVLLNRQPSLHRMSIMAHEVRILPYDTFRLNPCVSTPYAAEFDGDEMNMHILQTDESRAEAKSLMRVQEHILSPRFGGPIIGAIHDHITGAYLLTREGSEFPEDVAYQMVRKATLLDNPYVDKKHLQRKYRNWTGKELFSLLLPDDLNISYKAEICRKCETCFKEECQYDAFVVIKDGQLTNGVIDKSAYGSFSGTILNTIVKEYGSSRAKEFLDCSTRLAIDAISRIGFTRSKSDIEIPESALEVIDAHLYRTELAVDKLIEAYEEGFLIPLYGRTAEETLEMRIVQVLDESRDCAGKIAEDFLTMGKESSDDSMDYVAAVENHALVATRSGAGASMLDIIQETACVGQQFVRGGRIRRGYLDRQLPHFRKHEIGARAKGFISSSYNEGLDPIEFFFHAVGRREKLVEKSIRRAQTGYMQRRLVNALEDINVNSSGLVKDNQGDLIQSIFGEDGVDPAKSYFGNAANLDRLIDEMRKNDKDHSSPSRPIKKSKTVSVPKSDDVHKKEDFSDNYKELYELGFTLDDVNEEILHNYSKFKEFTEGIEFKYKIISFNLSEEDVALINQIIIRDITNQNISNENFSLVYDGYVRRYQKENSTFITDEELKENYKKLYDLGYRPKDITEENLEIYNQFNDYINTPIFKIKIRQLSLSAQNIRVIKKKIIADIINNVLIGDLDYLSLFKNYSKEIEDTDEKNIDWDNLLKQIDLSEYDEETIDYCIETVEKEYKSDEITQNEILDKFKFYLDKKNLEKSNLYELELIENDFKELRIKQFLTINEQEIIYRLTETEICDNGINGSVLDYVERKMQKKIDDNKSEARRTLKLFTDNKMAFINFTGLNEIQMYKYIDDVYELINENKIRDYDITDEFIFRTTRKYREYDGFDY